MFRGLLRIGQLKILGVLGLLYSLYYFYIFIIIRLRVRAIRFIIINFNFLANARRSILAKRVLIRIITGLGLHRCRN